VGEGLAVGCQLSAIGQKIGGRTMQDFHNLDVWTKAHSLTLTIYRLTKLFPDEERFGLISQHRRSSASIGSNLAEGCVRGSDADFARHVQIAMGSASEAQYQLLLAKDLGYLSADSHFSVDEEITVVKRMLASLLKKLNSPMRRVRK
jgi:four helix bundle protein